jgi:HSP20 family molecular chaperone IbpA
VRIREGTNRALYAETIELLDKVRTRTFEFFEKRGRDSGNGMRDWFQKVVFQVPDMELAETEDEFQLQFALSGFDAKDIRVSAFPDAVIDEGGPLINIATKKERAFLRIRRASSVSPSPSPEAA